MFDNDNILTSPRDVALDSHASEPLRMVLEDPHKSRWVKLLAGAIVLGVLFVGAGLVLYVLPGIPKGPAFWHVSLVSLLFWLSVTQGMLALSCLLRITHASWRYPLNRLLDISSLFGLWVFALFPLLYRAHAEIYALGSAEFNNNVWRMSGPIYFDALAIGVCYIAGWLLLYLTSLPDFAILRDRSPVGSKGHASTERHELAQPLCGQMVAAQAGRPARAVDGRGASVAGAATGGGSFDLGILASFIGSQTVLGWDFQLAAARNWDSSIFAPLFTLGSLLGGTALAALVMTAVNCMLGWRGSGFIKTLHYDNLGKLMIGLGLIWFYFRFCDYLTAWYGRTPEEWDLQKFRTSLFPFLALYMGFGCFVAPVFGNMIGLFRRSALGVCTISIFVLTGLATQRYLDTVPTFAPKYGKEPYRRPGLPGVRGHRGHVRPDVFDCRPLHPHHVLVGHQQGADAHGGAADGQRHGDGDGGRPPGVGDVRPLPRVRHSPPPRWERDNNLWPSSSKGEVAVAWRARGAEVAEPVGL